MLDRCQHILLIEDSPDDQELFKLALKRVAPTINLHCLDSAAEARLTQLKSERSPSFVILDHRVPTKEASIDFVKWARISKGWRRIPIILITSDISQADLDAAYEAGISSCLKKPNNFGVFSKNVELMLTFWCNHAQLPLTALKTDGD